MSQFYYICIFVPILIFILINLKSKFIVILNILFEEIRWGIDFTSTLDGNYFWRQVSLQDKKILIYLSHHYNNMCILIHNFILIIQI
jgi:hypothetical protein